MSVPPLLCSTPPPPDQIDDQIYNDDFTFNYEDSSPTPQYDLPAFPDYDSPSSKETNSEKTSPSDQPTLEPSVNMNHHNYLHKTADSPTPSSQTNIQTITNTDNQQEVVMGVEENIEDLDLQLDSMQIDLQNYKQSVEESLNSTFDDFGTFLGPTGLIESPESSLYVPKSAEVQSLGGQSQEGSSEREVRLQEVSDDSVSLQNDSDFDFENQIQLSDANAVDSETCQHKLSAEIVGSDLPNNEISSVDDDDVIKQTGSENLETVESKDQKDEVELKHVESDLKINVELDAPTDLNLELPSQPQTVIQNDVLEISFENFHELKIEDAAPMSDENTVSPVIPIDSFGVESSDSVHSTVPHDDDDDFCDFHKPVPTDACLTKQTDAIPDSTHSLFETTNAAVDDDDDFDDFATFQSSEPSKEHSSTFKAEITEDDIKFEAFTENNNTILHQDPQKDDDCLESDNDDFGDFGTYETSNVSIDNKAAESVPTSTVEASLNFTDYGKLNDAEMLAKLRQAVEDIFVIEAIEGDLEEDASKFDLNAVLGENWKHLQESEVEQTYLFQWNQSTSQKSLLKSLGIDARNILFGPKWNSSMPRFAANLGVNPLQPIRQLSTGNTADTPSEEKAQPASDTAAGNTIQPHSITEWENVTSFSNAEMQASCTERGEENASPHLSENISEPEPPPLKADKMAPPTVLNIGRKINLPDTHIFTPTDSETPWSRTIHYDDTNAETNISDNSNDFTATLSAKPTTDIDDFDDFQSHVVPESNQGTLEPKTEIKTTEFNTNFSNLSVTNLEDSFNVKPFASNPEVDDFDDFGDFHSATVPVASVPEVKSTPITLRVLEPVKLAPVVPVVNWPAPGEVSTTSFTEIQSFTLPAQPSVWNQDAVKVDLPEVTYPKSSGPVSFILKESRIDTISSDNPKDMLPTSGDSSIDFTTFSGFSETHSTIAESSMSFATSLDKPYIDPTNKTSKNVPFVNNGSSNDDFDDFQSVEYNPAFVSIPEPVVRNTLPLFTHSGAVPRQEMLPTTKIGYQTQNTPKTMHSNVPINNFERPMLEPVSFQNETTSKNTSQQILQPLSLENYSQINWPEPGIDLQDLSRFNPINSIQSYCEPKETTAKTNNVSKQPVDDDGWSDFVSIKPSNQSNTASYTPTVSNSVTVADDSEGWSDFVSSTALPSNFNEVKTISQNIHSQGTGTSNYQYKGNSASLNNTAIGKIPPPTSLPHLTYVNPKSSAGRSYNSHFQNL